MTTKQEADLMEMIPGNNLDYIWGSDIEFPERLDEIELHNRNFAECLIYSEKK